MLVELERVNRIKHVNTRIPVAHEVNIPIHVRNHCPVVYELRFLLNFNFVCG